MRQPGADRAPLRHRLLTGLAVLATLLGCGTALAHGVAGGDAEFLDTLAQVAERYLQVYREVLGLQEENNAEVAENTPS